jgi:hypothetical protein
MMTLHQPDANGHLSEVNSSLNNAIICHNIRDTEHIVSHACWRYRSGDLSAAVLASHAATIIVHV